MKALTKMYKFCLKMFGYSTVNSLELIDSKYINNFWQFAIKTNCVSYIGGLQVYVKMSTLKSFFCKL